MPYDPTKPVNGTLVDAAELRSQFAGLKTEIDARLTTSQAEMLIESASAGPTTGVAHLNLAVSNPPTQAQVQALANKVDELIAYLNREV